MDDLVRNRPEIVAAVDDVLANATATECRSMAGILTAVARARQRPLDLLEDHAMPPGVFGTLVRRRDRDQITVASWVHNPDRTLAHELGHLVLDHQGRAAVDLATSVLPDGMHDMAAMMLRRDCENSTDSDELAAEQFASLLLERMRRLGGGSHRLRSRWSEALG
ncbi:ImmA/IrrE family metallo-endopeptidase [Nocardia sp. CC213A]|uniref:ImmA/IrrE family metallo-endopeptidase n=1 Tax=Nocardia sp. CC213A TaxID=3044157 RepID=UPI00278C89D1|nr:hypothetical protein [Nocardia sp. CC213A]